MFITKILYLLVSSQKKKFFLLICFSVISSFLEMISLGLIFPVFKIISDINFVNSLANFLNNYGFLYLSRSFSREDLLVIFLILFFFLYILKFLFTIFLNLYQVNFINSVRISITNNFLFSTFSQDYQVLYKTDSSIFIKDLEIKITEFCDSFLPNFIYLYRDVVSIFMITGFLILIQPIGTLFSIALFILLFLFFNFYLKNKTAMLSKNREILINYRMKVIQDISKIFDLIKFFKKEDYFIKKIIFSLNEYLQCEKKFKFWLALQSPVIEFFSLICLLFFIIFSIFSNNSFDKSFPEIALFTIAMFRLMPLFHKIVNSYLNGRYYLESLNIIYAKIELWKKASKNQNFNIINFYNSINLINVSFKYQDEHKYVFQNMNLKINKGDVIKLEGLTGSGKTTLIKLIVGMYKPTSGKILIDDNFLKDSTLVFGLVSQNIVLLNDTIKKNIAFGIDENKINEELLQECISKSSLTDTVKNLTKKENTNIGELGYKLSGGQKQRLAIARALYLNSQILVFDEATSALDSETENKIIYNLFTQKVLNQTIIFITHKKDIPINFNRILRVENFKVNEY
jgi:ABC-type multidrug transport system fused ATPase/permease subunit